MVENKFLICNYWKMLTPIKQKLAADLAPLLGIDAVEIQSLLEMPKNLAHGHLSMPVFFLAKEKKMAPPKVAQEICAKLHQMSLPDVEKVEAVSGFVNFHLNDHKIFQNLVKLTTQNNTNKLGHSDIGSGKTVIIDYSSPNVAKPMHVGHLRATMIGQALRNLAESQGYKVVGLNHIGDWGTQFGKIILAYKLWHTEYDFKSEAFESLFKLYVRFHQEMDADPGLEARGAEEFLKLEKGDEENKKLWKYFIDISMADFEVNWKKLGVKHDLVRGESFYNDRLENVKARLTTANLLVESEGALVVDLTEEKMAPCLIAKSDGASLYATRDLASAFYRMEELKGDWNLYVVGNDQNLHFKQVFAVLKKMGFSWWEKCQHISFGMYRFKDMGKMSSRKGQIIRMSDLLAQSVDRVKTLMQTKNPNLENFDQVAEQVALGALVFNDLVTDRNRDVEFDWDKALSFEGDSGPYVQYVHVRCCSLLAKWGKPVTATVGPLQSDSEKILLKTLLKYEEVLTQSFRNFKPHILANYLLEVCSAFNQFYHAQRILDGETSQVESRLALVNIVRQVITGGLGVLNIQSPTKM